MKLRDPRRHFPTNFLKHIAMPIVHEPIHAPEFQRGEWLNSPPLSLSSLRGKIVLIDFWDYTCVNCLRTLPYLQEWWRRYRDAGLVVIGIHTPEFSFARNTTLVREAVQRLEIEYPVVLDNEHKIWQVWANRYWPAKYLVDASGYIRFFCYGEGNYRETELTIHHLLREINPAIALPEPMHALRATDEPGATCYRTTPELYLGYARGRIGNAEGYRPGEIVSYSLPELLQPDIVYLAGKWHNGSEALTLVSEQGSIVLRYHAKEVNLVMEPPGEETGRVIIEQDQGAPPADVLGADAIQSVDGTVVQVETPRLYQLINSTHYGEHTLRIHVLSPGLSVYDFTFVTECIYAKQAEEEAA